MKTLLDIPEAIQKDMSTDTAFEEMMQLKGEAFRDMPGRLTLKLALNNESYFIKQHFGVGWLEIFKNLLSFKWPIIGAETEWNAIKKLNALGIPTTPLVGYGKRGCNPATMQSFVLTKDLGDITSLETLCADWKQNPPMLKFKRDLIKEVARIAKTLHGNGMNHRDFYICHFCLDNPKLRQGELCLYLIDLHRVGIRPKITHSAKLKDLAGLYFSAMDIGLTKRDYLRFLRDYCDDLREDFLDNKTFWNKIEARALKLHAKYQRKISSGEKL